MLGLFDWLFGKKDVQDVIVVDKPKQSAPVNNNENTPPFDEMRQWIIDNWRSIETEQFNRELPYAWKVKCSLFNVKVYDSPLSPWREVDWILRNGDDDRPVMTGFNRDEVTQLVGTYKSIVEGRYNRLEVIRVAKQRKKMADKLKQLGYGDGSYE